jgi:hypothetical protein
MACNPTGIGRMSPIIEMARRRQSGDLGLLAASAVYTWTRLALDRDRLVIYWPTDVSSRACARWEGSR